jgi:hypothetical protein
MARFLLVSVVLGPRAAGRLPRSLVINLAELTISCNKSSIVEKGAVKIIKKGDTVHDRHLRQIKTFQRKLDPDLY